MIDVVPVYDHQAEYIQQLRDAFRYDKGVIACSPTGSGKSRMAKHILGEAVNKAASIPAEDKSGRMLVVVFGRNLVDNLSDSFNESPRLPHGVIMADSDKAAPAAKVQVASIDTLTSAYCQSGEYVSDITYDMMVVDECHSHHPKMKSFHAVHDKRRKDMGLSSTRVLGLSATPAAKGLGDLYGKIVVGKAGSWLQEHGYASPYRYIGGTKVNFKRLKRSVGLERYTKKSIVDASDKLQGEFVRDWLKYASDRPTIGFFPSIAQAEVALELLLDAGVKAGFVHAKTGDYQRRLLMQQLASGDIQYLVNVGVFERGTNIPCVACVQLCCVIGSVARYLQMIGRGSRTSEGKDDCVVIDHATNVKDYGGWEDPRIWELDISVAGSAQLVKPSIECPQCNEIYRGGVCKNCGYEPTKAERKKQKLEFDGEELQAIEPPPFKKKLKSNEEILVDQLYRGAYSGWSMKQLYFFCCKEAEKQGTKFRMPKTFHANGRQHISVYAPNKRVKHVYTWLGVK